MSTSQPVSFSIDSGVATLTLQRPEAMNSLTLAAKVALRDGLHEAAADASVRCVVLTGSGRGFCAGQDLTELQADLASGAPLSQTVTDHYNPMVTSILTMPKPVIAAINGTAAGAGLSLAAAADLRIAARSAKFTTAFAAIGLSCDTAISWTLPRLVGPTRAADLLLRPRPFSSDEALEWGLLTEVVDDDGFADRVALVAAELAAGPTLALASIKRAMAFSASHDLASSLDHEAQKMSLTGASHDHRVAVQAFKDKQKATFVGR